MRLETSQATFDKASLWMEQEIIAAPFEQSCFSVKLA
jgi:hypothetical protein